MEGNKRKNKELGGNIKEMEEKEEERSTNMQVFRGRSNDEKQMNTCGEVMNSTGVTCVYFAGV